MHSKMCSNAPFIYQCWGVIHCKYFKAVEPMFFWSIWNAGFNQAKIIFRPDTYFAWDSQAFYQSPRMIRRPIIKSCFNGIAWWFISRLAFHVWKHTGSAVIKQQKITLTSSLSYGYQNVYFNYVLTPWQSKVFHHVKHLRTRGKCKKHESQVSVFDISLAFSNVRVFYSSISILIEFYLSWIFLSFRSFSWGIWSLVTCFDQSCASKNI